ncbi:MAG: GreA/GreB family elongation factor [Bacteroidota bacterium]
MKNNISITEQDYIKLCDLVRAERMMHPTEINNLSYLGAEIKRAKRIRDIKSATGIITMNSLVEVIDMDTGREMKVKLVYPGEADFKKGNVSVLSMFGSALLGYKVGSIISYKAPGGIKKVQIKNVSHLEEAH